MATKDNFREDGVPTVKNDDVRRRTHVKVWLGTDFW
jgi:hypothetical protein